VDEFPDVDSLDERERAALRSWLRCELAEIEIRRRFLHERIDLLRGELRRRWSLRFEVLGDDAASLSAVSAGGAPSLRRFFTGSGAVSFEPLGGLPDLTTLLDGQIKHLIAGLKAREDDVSLRRRELHLRLDLL
jgi:hypothetical protein